MLQPAPDDFLAWMAGLNLAPPGATAPAKEVQETADFRRIRDAERIEWQNATDLPQICEWLSAQFRTPSGDRTLRPGQAAALLALKCCGTPGAFIPLATGTGKTDVSFLAAEVIGALRPLLIIPAKMINSGKTQREHEAARRRWRIRPLMPKAMATSRGPIGTTAPLPLRCVSYEALGRESYTNALEAWNPDLIICDEVHKLRHTSAAVTRKISKFVRVFHPRVLLESGSVTNREIQEMAHLLKWCLGDGTPLPTTFHEFQMWSWALNEKVPDAVRIEPGALLSISPPAEGDTLMPDGSEASDRTIARRRFARRLLTTKGVVGSVDDLPKIGLLANVISLPPTAEVQAAADHMRQMEETPCGIPMEMPSLECWRHDRELSCDFYYRWDTQPPFEWKWARKSWASFVREKLKGSRKWHSPMDLVNAIDRREVDDLGLLSAWRNVRHLFDPEKHKEPVWLGDQTLRYCAEWLEREKGICWVAHQCFGKRLMERTGVPYFAAGGKCKGVAIDTHRGPAIASIKAVNEGFNLQTLHSKNLIATTPTTNLENEQLISRTHREGQTEDDVEIVFLQTLPGDCQALTQARADAMYVQSLMMQPQRLCYATWLNEA